ncbi:MAG: primosomal protein N' [Deltaproteobacteria bacterium]|nr:primosomal protein N' [Deltaproteobacteria bacterium]
MLIDVALPVPLMRTFSYRLAADMSAPPGVRVRVPFGSRVMVGVVVGEGAAVPNLKRVTEVLDPEPILTVQELAFARWLADYYEAPLGECTSLFLPPRMADGEAPPADQVTTTVRAVAIDPAAPEPRGPKPGPKMTAALEWIRAHGEASTATVRGATGITLDSLRRLAERGLVELIDERRFRDPLAGVNLASLSTPRSAFTTLLNPAQLAVATTLVEALGSYRGFLLRGVTGSGKTEVYLALLEAVLARGEGAIVLVPEIALTPQLVARFRSRLGERVAIQHSGLDPNARHEQWLRVRAGELPIVVGARSALFAPIPRLGAVVVDEEHDPSFKQESSPRYHARDLALVRGHLAGCPVVLGSATPSLESWANVHKKKLTRLDLPERAGPPRPLPSVEVVDLRHATFSDKDRIISRTLEGALRDTLAAGEQAILFLNRRGFSSFVQCTACGHALACESCSVTYTWHRGRGRLVCHYCDRTRAFPRVCPTCAEPELTELGFGTEQVEATLATLIPEARVARMDRDTTRGKALFRLLARFRKREVDVLVGTQMVAKGHDFPGVTLVGVLAAEQGLNFPDPRAAERTFQLLTQIAGRAGRAGAADAPPTRPGRVLVQSWDPEHYAIAHATRHDTLGFLDLELDIRRQRRFPPWSQLALFRIGGPDPAATEAQAVALRRALAEAAKDLRSVEVHEALPAPIERIKDRWRFQVLVACHGDRRELRRALEATRGVWAQAHRPGKVQIALDVDPHQFL